MRHIVKVGLAVVDGDRILLVRKRGLAPMILPGGKPEDGEDDVGTIVREIHEELGCGIVEGSLSWVGEYSDLAAGTTDTMVTIRLFKGALDGDPGPRAEIDEAVWFDTRSGDRSAVASSLRDMMLPVLFPDTWPALR